MMYFVTGWRPYSPKNRACSELIEYAKQFENVLINDEKALEYLKGQLSGKAKELNLKYPKLKQITLSGKDLQIRACIPSSCGVPDEIFIMNISKVRGVYFPDGLLKKDLEYGRY